MNNPPHVLVWHHPLERHHRCIGSTSRHHREDLTVGGTVDPRRVRQVRWIRAFRRKGAVTLRRYTVAKGTVLLIGRRASGDVGGGGG